MRNSFHALLVILAAVAWPAHALLEAAADRIAAAARWEIETKAVPSIAIALVDRNGVVWSQAWGHADAEGKVPATTASVYRAGSVSKLFTDVAIMRLVEQGKIDLDKPVTTYLPGFRPRNPFGGVITLRQLMTHRSGLVREPPRGHYFDMAPKGQADTVASLNETTLVAAPGALTKYSNAGIAVVGQVLATMTGKPYEQAVHDLVLSPLGMNASSMTLAPLRDKIAYSEMASFDSARTPAPLFDLGMPAAGSLYTTTGDLGRFAVAMLNHGGGLIKPTSLDEMWRPQYAVQNGSRTFGLGFIVTNIDGQRVVGHSGGIYGFSTELRLMPEAGIGAIVFSTVDSGASSDKLVRYALQAFLAERTGKPLPVFSTSEAVTGDEARRLSGWYSDGHQSVGVRIYQGQLAIDGPESAGMIRKSGGAYRIEDAQLIDDALSFAPDASWVELDGKRYVRAVQPEPFDPEPAFAALIGDYGWPHNILRIYERDGQPYVRIEWTDWRPLHRIDADTYAFPNDRGLYPRETLHFVRGASGVPIAATLNGISWPRRDFGQESQDSIRRGLNGDVGALPAAALAAQPPVETTKPAAPPLVALTSLDPSIKLEIRYADHSNFLGLPVYSSVGAFMRRPAAEAVARASQQLHARGYGLLIHNAYRPWYVTKMFWDATPPEHHMFVADPSRGSRHNRGAAVDLTMYYLATGKPIVATGRYDEMSARSYSNYVGGTDHQRWLREVLRAAMEANGFTVYPEEWWHFDYGAWADYPIGNVTFEDLRAGKE
ncbi:serine hydrolase [Sphingomonas sp. MMS24-J13]|uniref:serine hydrolase n=1 Tax=Sphingomonas sp. MMS24-J13 TaxID=3238686 RepID=UPI00384E4005